MKRVLIIDDAAFMRSSIRSILEKNGYEVVGEAEDGLSGVKKYVELFPDIVTMDITMPGMDGVQALKEIKEIDETASVVIITAQKQESKMIEAITSGARGFIIKPFIEEALMRVFNIL